MDWLKRHAIKLRAKPLAVFSVCLTPACRPERLAEARGYALPVRMELGLQPVSEGVFAGAHDPSRLTFGDRLKARSMGARAGDYIEPQAIDEWAGQVGRLLAN
jgi:menaquinone-dependent protoporphyrinogen IX oxidase